MCPHTEGRCVSPEARREPTQHGAKSQLSQCSKLLPVRQPEADNFGGGPGNFLKLFFNFMFMIWDSRQQDWQLFWLSFEHWTIVWGNVKNNENHVSWAQRSLQNHHLTFHDRCPEKKSDLSQKNQITSSPGHVRKISDCPQPDYLPALAASVSDNFSSPDGDSRWQRDKWLEVTVPVLVAPYRGHY